MQLANVRSTFVNAASKELISQLLDDLLEQSIVNDGEKDSILEENLSRADKARSLIDTVRKKGERACQQMILHLKQRDPTLHSELGLP